MHNENVLFLREIVVYYSLFIYKLQPVQTLCINFHLWTIEQALSRFQDNHFLHLTWKFTVFSISDMKRRKHCWPPTRKVLGRITISIYFLPNNKVHELKIMSIIQGYPNNTRHFFKLRKLQITRHPGYATHSVNRHLSMSHLWPVNLR